MNFNYTKSFIISIIIFILGCEANKNYLINDPNIVIIYTDDLGYGDVSAYQKGTLKTPNIDKLANYSKLLNSRPIFINQLSDNGNYNKKLFILNYSLINHCKKRNYDCIDLASQLVGEDDFWWDGIHTTPKGSQKIADLIFPDLKKILKEN